MEAIKFRQALYHSRTGAFYRWHHWGLINGEFIGLCLDYDTPAAAIGNSYQYLGQRDANGVEICQGDILKGIGSNAELVTQADLQSFYGWPNIPAERYEIMGNIVENPNLLGGKPK